MKKNIYTEKWMEWKNNNNDNDNENDKKVQNTLKTERERKMRVE